MKNTTFRKKALLSSVAMLLVAFIALGSATFAWFTANPKAYASGIKLKTTASTGLVIRTETDEAWSHAAALYKGQTDAFNLNPVSQDQTTPANFWTVLAEASNNFKAKSGEAMTPGTEDIDFYAEKIYFRLSDGSALEPEDSTKAVYIESLAITPSAGATMQNAIRVAIADKNGALLGTWALSTAGANGTLTTAAQTSGSFSPALEAVEGAADTKVLDAKALKASGDDLTQFCTVYVYLDGQDGDCNSDKVGTINAKEIISGIQVDFILK